MNGQTGQYTLFCTIWDTQVVHLTSGIGPVINNLLSEMQLQIAGMIMLLIITFGVLMSLGRLQWHTGIIYILRSVIISALLKGTAYNDWVTNTFMDTLPKKIAQATGTTGTTLSQNTTCQQFDRLEEAVAHMAAGILQQTDITMVAERFTVHLAEAACESMLILAFVIYALAYAIMALVVAAGVVMVAFFLFDRTSAWANHWIGKLVSLSIVMLLVGIQLQLTTTANVSYMRSVQGLIQAAANTPNSRLPASGYTGEAISATGIVPTSSSAFDAQISLLWQVFGCFFFTAAVMLAIPLIASTLGGSAIASGANIIIMPLRSGAGAMRAYGSGATRAAMREAQKLGSKI